jgi:hypothetical protein
MPIADLVAHVRRWIATDAKGVYRRFLEVVPTMPDEAIADIVRFARTPRGAEMALVHALKDRRY